MSRESIINNFLEETFAGDAETERSALLGYEAFKERKAITNPNFLLNDNLYKEYAGNFFQKMKVICLLRQYEDFKAHLLVTLN